MNKFNNKKTIIILILLLLVGIVGVTIAYFSNTTSINNLFSTKKYGTTVTEEFVSPDNWLPGDITEKTIVATNSGSVDEAVRIKVTEKWLDSNNNELNGWIHADGTKSNHTTEEELSTDERVAIINFDNTSDWTYNNGYYYYNYKLAPNESTSSLIKSVTFNPKTKLDDTCTTTTNGSSKTVTCNSSGTGYDNAIYTLTFTIETVQFNKYGSAWGTDIVLALEKPLFCDSFEIGEIVKYNNQDYYVLKYSSTSDNYVTLLKKDPLTAEEVNAVGTDYLSIDGEYPYFESATCNENDESGCSTNYDTSDIKKIIDGWSNSFDDDLVSIDGYKAKIVNSSDFELRVSVSATYTSYSLYPSSSFIRASKDYWTSLIIDDSNKNVSVINQNYNLISNNTVYSRFYIRPIINIKKSALNVCYSNGFKEYKQYNRGEEVTYCNDDYYVLYDSDENKKYVTLLKKDVLTAEEVNKYSYDYESSDGSRPYSSSFESSSYGCEEYPWSNIKINLDNWASKYGNDLYFNDNNYIDRDGVRLLSSDDLRNLGYYQDSSTSNYDWVSPSNIPEWITNVDNYWTMGRAQGICNFIYINNGNVVGDNIDSIHKVRPVLNIKKQALEQGCNLREEKEYLTCKKGSVVTYDNDKYYVMKNSSSSNEYVQLLKQKPLTKDEVNTYGKGYTSTDGTFPYCINENSCSDSFYYTDLGKLVSNWSNQHSSGLIYKNNGISKATLLDKNQLEREFGYVNNYSTNDTPSWIKSNYLNDYGYCSLNRSENYFGRGIRGAYKVGSSLNGIRVTDTSYVRPVINIKKGSIESGCGKKNENVEYSIGESINYKNNNYCVIKDSLKNDDYVTLIKNNPLTYDETVTYNNGYEIGRNNDYNDIGIVSFYKSNSCYYNDENDKNLTGCNSSYNDSFIKNIVNNWSSSISNDLKEVNGYKARLISIDDLFGLGYSIDNRATQNLYLKTDDVPECIYNSNYSYNYWTMSRVEDSNETVYIVNKDGNISGYYGDPRDYKFERDHEVYSKNAIRPVINLKKCAIEGTC